MAEISEETREDLPGENDGWVTLDGGRYYVTLGQSEPAGQLCGGFPVRAVAVYELARMMADRGEFPAAWISGEHGPAAEGIDSEVRAYCDEVGDKLKPLPGTRYVDGAAVSLAGDDWPAWIVDRDYGDLGVMIHTEGDPDVATLATHDRLTPRS